MIAAALTALMLCCASLAATLPTIDAHHLEARP